MMSSANTGSRHFFVRWEEIEMAVSGSVVASNSAPFSDNTQLNNVQSFRQAFTQILGSLARGRQRDKKGVVNQGMH